MTKDATDQPEPSQHRLVIVGGGVAGLDMASRLAGKTAGSQKLSVTLVDRDTAYVWKPMLHTIAAGTSDAGTQQTVFAAQAQSHGFTFHLGEATAIDRHKRQIWLAPIESDGEEVVPERLVDYDTLVLAVGSKANDFGTPGVAEQCARIDNRQQAMAFNDRMRIRLLKHAYAGTTLTVGIVGGGATGVELAAELIQVVKRFEHYGLESASSRLQVKLLEAAPRLLGPFPEDIASAAEEKLRQLGVEVRTDAQVGEVTHEGFHLTSGEQISTEMKVWAAGIKAAALVSNLTDLEKSRAGQLVVGPDLRVPGDPHIFALGDCASPQLPGREMPVPATAQAAHQQARYLCRNIPRLIAGEAVAPSRYKDFGSLVSLGGFDAYGTLGRFGLFKKRFIRGRIAQLGHDLLYRSYQVRLHGLFKGTLLWLIDMINRRVKANARLE